MADPRVTWQQRRDMKMLFYSGAEAMYRIMHREGLAAQNPSDAADEHIRAELDEFSHELIAARSQGEG